MSNTITEGFSESLRYDYPLSPASRVIDAGFYEGQFALQIAAKHGCRVDAYEPVREFYGSGIQLLANQGALPGVIQLYHGAIGVWRGSTRIVVRGSSSSPLADSGDRLVEQSPLHLIDDVIGDGCDLLKLNIEGMEFDVLERMVKCGLASRCRDIQVQFHSCVPNAEARWKWIRAQLLITHHLTYDFPWCWENYERNES